MTEAKHNDPEGRKKDRRVDILVTKKGSSEQMCW
jgi:flagellar motor protein MotB